MRPPRRSIDHTPLAVLVTALLAKAVTLQNAAAQVTWTSATFVIGLANTRRASAELHIWSLCLACGAAHFTAESLTQRDFKARAVYALAALAFYAQLYQRSSGGVLALLTWSPWLYQWLR